MRVKQWSEREEKGTGHQMKLLKPIELARREATKSGASESWGRQFADCKEISHRMQQFTCVEVQV